MLMVQVDPGSAA